MILRPLCVSDDMDSAIGYARSFYATAAQGSRPITRITTYFGASDWLLIRAVLGISPESDVVQIMRIPKPQTLLFVVNEWDDPGKSTNPFYGPASANPHIESGLVPTNTGTLIVVGPGTGVPAVLTSTDPSIMSVTDRPTTYAEALALAGGDLGGYLDTNCTVTGFTLTLNDYGATRFYLDRPAVGGWGTLDQMYGGEHIFRHAPGGTVMEMWSEGGMVIGGESAIVMSDHAILRSEGGGLVIGGASAVTREWEYYAQGGMVIGGESAVVYQHLRPLADAIGPFVIPWANRLNYQFPLGGTAMRGGAITTRIVSRDPAFSSLTDSGLASFNVPGPTAFSYVAVETKNGLSIDSLPVAVSITVQAPIYPPTADSFAVSVPFADRNTLQLVLRGHGTRGGALSYGLVGADANISLTTNGTSNWSATFPGIWSGDTWFQYWLTEYKDGIRLYSNVATVSVTVQRPPCPVAEFTTTALDNDIIGVQWTLDNVTPASLDGEPVTVFWEVIQRPYNSAAALSDTFSDLVRFTPDVAGTYMFKLTITDSYGQSTSDYQSSTATAPLTPPVLLAAGYRFGYSEIEANKASIQLVAVPKRGGTITKYERVGTPTGATMTFVLAWLTGYVLLAAPTAVGVCTVKFRVEETTSDGVALWSNPVEYTITVTADMSLTIDFNLPATMTVGSSAARNAVSDPHGGAVSFITYSTTILELSGNTVTAIGTGTGSVTMTQEGSGAYKTTSKTKSTTVSAYIPPAPSWQKVWTSPKKDIRTKSNFGSFLIMEETNGICNYGWPLNISRRVYTSQDGHWRVTGDYWQDPNWATYYQTAQYLGYGTLIDYLDDDLAASGLTGYNFVWTSGGYFYTVFPGLGGCGSTFYVRELWHLP